VAVRGGLHTQALTRPRAHVQGGASVKAKEGSTGGAGERRERATCGGGGSGSGGRERMIIIIFFAPRRMVG
jgi:hypothetical protein